MKTFYKYIGLTKRKKSKKVVASGTDSVNNSRGGMDNDFGKSGKDDKQQNKNSNIGKSSQSGGNSGGPG